MKSILFPIFFIIISFSCNNSKNTENEVVTNEDSISAAPEMVGNDIDEHGCKPSAGYNWSDLRKECVRVFEIGSKFSAAGVNKDETFAAYIILNQKNDSAEVFLPNIKPFIAVKSSKNNLFESKLSNITITNDKSNVNINRGGDLIFSQPKSEGIGKILGLK